MRSCCPWPECAREQRVEALQRGLSARGMKSRLLTAPTEAEAVAAGGQADTSADK